MRLKGNLLKNVFTPCYKQPGIKKPQQRGEGLAYHLHHNKISPPETLDMDDAKIKQIASIFSSEIIRQIKGENLVPITMLR